jgi:hypothetical protein
MLELLESFRTMTFKRATMSRIEYRDLFAALLSEFKTFLLNVIMLNVLLLNDVLQGDIMPSVILVFQSA